VYLEFYGLTRRPFDMTPDPSFFFPSQKHTEALSSLVYAITQRRGFVVITGEIGSGKTTVCRTLLQKLDPAAKVALLTNTTLTAKQLLEAICHQFGISTERQNKVGLLGRMNAFLREQNDVGNTVVLIVDEAQNLSVKALEETRLISNMETDTHKLIQIMLLGQPELRDKLNRPDLEQLRQRISLRYHLRSLSRSETEQYIEHRLKIAGDDAQAKFTKKALDCLYDYSKGTPRLINVVCDQALLLGYLRETKKIDETIVREITAEFAPPEQEEENVDERMGGRPCKPSGLRRFFRKGRGFLRRSSQRDDEIASSPMMEETSSAEHAVAQQQSEEQILSKLGQFKLASICAENGHFAAKLDGVLLRPGDHVFGMSVERVEENRVVFRFEDKEYQLAIENYESGTNHALR
jgi:general secretion pathway protein A